MDGRGFRNPAARDEARDRALRGSHRAIRRLDFPAGRWLVLLLLPLGFSLAFWHSLGWIVEVWARLCSMWLAWLHIEGATRLNELALPGGSAVKLLELDVDASLPERGTWVAVAAATLAAMLASYAIPLRHAPARYLLRLAAIVQATALLFFAWSPQAFPHTAQEHLRTGFQMTLVLLAVLPWLHALIYYIFDFSLLQKATLTLLTMGYLVVLAPFQYLCHAWLLHVGSLLLLPLLHLLFGILPNILAIVALYAWAMSWRRREAARPQRL